MFGIRAPPARLPDRDAGRLRRPHRRNDMKSLIVTTLIGASCLALAACGERETNSNEAANGAATGEATGSEPADGNAAASAGTAAGAGAAAGTAAFPKGARIVEENGVTYRVDADGARVRLGDTDSRIVVENGVRYRVDPGGSRVRIDAQGLDIDVDTPDVDLPDVDVGINKKGNPDIDVKDKSDGNDGPN
jgi:hypothetical protein